MRRWLLAVAFLVGGALPFARAEYVYIRCILGGKKDQNQGAGEAPSGGPGSLPGLPGGPPNGPGGGPPGAGGGDAPPSGGGPGDIPTSPNGGLPGSFGPNVDTAAIVVMGVTYVTRVPPTPGFISRGIRVHTRYTKDNGAISLWSDSGELQSFLIPNLPSVKAQYKAKHL